MTRRAADAGARCSLRGGRQARRPRRERRQDLFGSTVLRLTCLAGAALAAADANAASFDLGGGVAAQWYNEIRLGTDYRLNSVRADVDEQGRAGPSLHRGFATARVDLLSELDLRYENLGLHLGAAAWDDELSRADNPSSPTLTFHRESADRDHFASRGAVRRDRGIELLDAFVKGSTTLDGNQLLSLRLGRQVLVWGESHLFPESSIAGTMSPLGKITAAQGLTYQARDVFLPVGRAVVTWQPTDDVTVEVDWPFEYRAGRAGTYDEGAEESADVISSADVALISRLMPGAAAADFVRTRDERPGAPDQWGVALKRRSGSYSLGLYALRFDAKTPVTYLFPTAAAANGTWRFVYPTGIELYGASLAGLLGDTSFGAEISARRNMPLVAPASVIAPGRSADNAGHPAYPTGDTLHGVLSSSWAVPPVSFLSSGASWTGEIVAEGLIAAGANSDRLPSGRSLAAAAFRMIFEPQFPQVLPGLDLSLPIGFAHGIFGRSPIHSDMDARGGDISIGITARTAQGWRAEVNLVHYIGDDVSANPAYAGSGVTPGPGDILAFTIHHAL